MKELKSLSIIIPAYNAAATITKTLESLVKQTSSNWQAIVINDGSMDETLEIANYFAAKDSRFKIINQSNLGGNAARNQGIKSADFDWLVFLDADDWLAPEYVEKMTEAIASHPNIDAFHCQWMWVAKDEIMGKDSWQHEEDVFSILVKDCPFPPSACVVRRTIVEAVGGFDITFKSCQDWDFWQRIARTGASFAPVLSVLSYYRMRPDSVSVKNPAQILQDGLRVLEYGHSTDSRVPNSHPAYINGLSPSGLPHLKFDLLSWCAGIILSRGDSPGYLFDNFHNVSEANLDPYSISENIFKAVLRAQCQTINNIYHIWPIVEKHLDEFLQTLTLKSGTPNLAHRVRHNLEAIMLYYNPDNLPVTIGYTHAVLIEITEPILDILPPHRCDRLHCRIEMEGNFLGTLELPIIDGKVSSWVIEDAIAAEFAWLILGKYFEHNIYATTHQNISLHNQIGWTIFIQQIWGLYDWPNERFYNPDYLDTVQETKYFNDKILTLEISDNIPNFQVKYSPITAIVTAGGVPFVSVKITAENNLITAQKLRGTINLATGFELCRICVREALLGQPLTDATTLRERLAAKAKKYRQKLTNNTLVLGRRLGKIDTSISRRAMLPVAAAKDLLQMVKVSRETVIKVATPQEIIYAPDVILPPKKPKNQQNIINKFQNFVNSLFIKHPQESLVARSVGNWDNGITEKLPILRYSQVDSAIFEEQLRYLRDNGFYGINATQWLDSMIAKCPLPAGSLWITFDQGYLDFYQNAWPLLKKYGFTATVFLATDQVGSVNQQKIPLLGWAEIKQLQKAGVEFGSMGVSYRHLTALSAVEIVQEASRSRTILTQKLGVSIHTFAYPFGDYDPIVEHLIGACGYTLGLNNDNRLSTFNDKLLAQPRIEVKSNDRLEELIAKLRFS